MVGEKLGRLHFMIWSEHLNYPYSLTVYHLFSCSLSCNQTARTLIDVDDHFHPFLVHICLLQATEALLLTEEEDTPTASPTVTSAAAVHPPSQPGGGAIRPPVHPPQAQATAAHQRSAPTPTSHNPSTPAAAMAPVAPLNFGAAAPSQPSTVGGQVASAQQQVAGGVTTPTTTPSLPPYKQEDLHKWLYKDPQGEVQGECALRERKREKKKRTIVVWGRWGERESKFIPNNYPVSLPLQDHFLVMR